MADTTHLEALLSLVGQGEPTHVHAWRGREEVSRPFRYVVDFSGVDLDVEAARGERAHLLVRDAHGQERHLTGLCREVAVAGRGPTSEDAKVRYRVELVPEAYHVLSLRQSCRVFQQLDVKGIVREVCREAGLADSTFDWSGVEGRYLKRDLCLQYDESDWDFVCRLLEDEGIHFRFDHAAEGTTMAFCDDAGRAPKIAPEELPFVLDPEAAGGKVALWGLSEEARVAEATATLRDYDMLRPALDLTAKASAREVVERDWYEWSGGYADPDEGKRRARLRLDELRTACAGASARTNCLPLVPGKAFKLSDHPWADGAFFAIALEVDVRLEDDEVAGPLTEPGKRQLQLGLELSPQDACFRPARITPRPRIGLQTAIVTGPPGQEIHCDEHGRVKVQFHWDRVGKLDDHSSCWLRVSQPHTTGAILIPRIGWEVLVEFLDGDPDRPVVLGRLWNLHTPPPAQLPGEKTQTSHSSVSSPGGGGANQVLFEDAKGAEKVSILGHKDIAVTAAHDVLVNVGHNFTRKVGGHRKVQVGTDEKVSVKSNQDHQVGGSEDVTVGARSIKVSGTATEDVLADRSVQIGSMEQVKVGNPAAAVVQLLASVAVEAAAGAAAQAASRAQAALLGPIKPALDAARQALGNAAPVAGPAAALLGPKGPDASMFGDAAAKLDAVAGGAEAAGLASGLVKSVLGKGLEEAGLKGPSPTAAGAEAGAGGAGADAAPAGADGPRSGGAGVQALTVAGSMTETVGGLYAVNALGGISRAIGGSSREQVGGARIDVARKGKAETTGGAKTEAVAGLYWSKAGDSIALSAQAVTLTFAGTQRQRISGGHSVSAQGAVNILTPRLKLEGGEAITLTCGDSKVVVDSDGVYIEASTIVYEGSKVEVDQGALGT